MWDYKKFCFQRKLVKINKNLSLASFTDSCTVNDTSPHSVDFKIDYVKEIIEEFSMKNELHEEHNSIFNVIRSQAYYFL